MTVNKNYPAVQFRTGDLSSVLKTTISIKGTLYRPLFRNQKFHGKIIVEKYNYSNYEMYDELHRDISNGWGRILYYDDKPSGFQFGSIWKMGDFDSLKILVNEPISPEAGSSTGINLQIIAPATDYESALKIFKEYKK